MMRSLWLVWHFLTHRWTRYTAAWVMALLIAGWQQYLAQRAFKDRNDRTTEREKMRPDVDDNYAAEHRTFGWSWFAQEKMRTDGNDGHTSIDFAGQWLMGRMLTKGYGRY